MEKSAAGSAAFIRSRLLVLYALCAVCLLFAAGTGFASTGRGPAPMAGVLFRPLSTPCFVGAESGFSAYIEGAAPEHVQFTVPDMGHGISFVSSKKEAAVRSSAGGTTAGTVLTVWLRFSEPQEDPDVLQLPPVLITVSGRRYTVPFAAFTVLEDPALVQPRLIVAFTKGIRAGQNDAPDAELPEFSSVRPLHNVQAVLGVPVHFTVYVQYAAQVQNFEWNLQKDALLDKTADYEAASGMARGSFSDIKVPVADFVWQPLAAGQLQLPAVTVAAVSYAGVKTDLALPDGFVTVTEPLNTAPKTDEISGTDRLFSSAFVQPAQPEVEQTDERFILDPARLAELRGKERRSLPHSAAAAARRTLEMQAGLGTVPAEPSVPLLYAALLGGILLLVCGVLLLKIQRRSSGGVCAAAACALLVTSLFLAARLRPLYGIYCGGRLYAVPEVSASAKDEPDTAAQTASGQFVAGSRVKILEKTGKWIYIDMNGSGGWVTADTVLPIR